MFQTDDVWKKLYKNAYYKKGNNFDSSSPSVDNRPKGSLIFRIPQEKYIKQLFISSNTGEETNNTKI